MGDTADPILEDGYDNHYPELEEYSPAVSEIGPVPISQPGKCDPGSSRADILRRKIAIAELELAKQRMELDLAELMEGETKGDLKKGIASPGVTQETSQLPNLIDPSCSTNLKLNPNFAASNNMAAGTCHVHPPLPPAEEGLFPQLLSVCMGLPKREIPKFNGNPLNYWSFIRAFNSGVTRYTNDAANRLSYLLHYCEGDALESIEHCSMLDPELGYAEALKVLEDQFGDARAISREYVTVLTDGPAIKGNDAAGLSRLASKMKASEITLTQFNHESQLRSERTLGSIVGRLPAIIQSQWYDLATSIQKSGREPNFSDLTEFIRDKAAAAKLQQRFTPDCGRQPKVQASSSYETDRKRLYSLATSAVQSGSNGERPRLPRSCSKCGQDHYLDTCFQFLSLSQPERMKLVNESALCRLCLKANHTAKICQSRRYCGREYCRLPHHPLLHPAQVAQLPSNTRAEARINFQREQPADQTNTIAMGLIPVTVVGPLGRRTVCGLLDSGSDATLIHENLALELGLPGTPSMISISTVTGRSSVATKRVSFQVEPECAVDGPIAGSAWTVKQLPNAGMPNFSRRIVERWSHLRDIDLPHLDRSRIEILLGMNIPSVHWVLERKVGDQGDPYAIKTPLGWTILGPIGDRNHMNALHLTCSDEQDLEKSMERMYRHDFNDPPVHRPANSLEDERALDKVKNTCKFVDGHYETALPWREGCPALPNNYPIAYHRLLSLRRKLLRDAELHEVYEATIQGYLEHGYAEVVDAGTINDTGRWYLPHHPVVHPHKPGKVRVVFDCAASWKKTSLNAQLLTGPDVVNRLFGVLMRFRRFCYVAKADVEAMFHQVGVSPSDRKYLRFLWWLGGDFNSQPSTLQMRVHPFGATSSPFCASFVLQQALRNSERLNTTGLMEEACSAFYVDDFLHSCQDETQLLSLASAVRDTLSAAGFRLTKWCTNASALIKSFPVTELEGNCMPLDLEGSSVNRTLGIDWDMAADEFRFNVKPFQDGITRRKVLSFVASLYDPLGLVAPVLLPAKLFLQELCMEKRAWDEEVDGQHRVRWNSWLNDFASLQDVRITRCILPRGLERSKVELHCFSDAAERAYGAVLYLRTINEDGCQIVSLLCGKSKVAPLHTVSIPRLELTAAVVAVRLALQVKAELMVAIDSTFFWSDSMIVLHMIRNQRTRYETFFANRLSVIHELSEVDQWRYVSTKLNPADVASRGASATRLKETVWFNGPDFLRFTGSPWPTEPVGSNDAGIRSVNSVEVPVITDVTVNENVLGRFSRYGDWLRLLRAIGWIRRYLRYLRRNKEANCLVKGPLQVWELDEARKTIVRLVQRCQFPRELKELSENSGSQGCRTLKRVSSSLKALSPFVEEGCMRVGGRLTWADTSHDIKHPYVLPKDHFVTELLIKYYHEMSGHAGATQVLATIRRRYWIIRGLSAVKGVVRKCGHCLRWFSKPCEQVMAPLPLDRTTPNLKPFTNVGVDYFGPILVKRGRGTEKRYGCIFTCLTIRAVHLEVSHSLDTDSFLCAFTRFVSRRGNPARLYSDNGTNFRGAEAEVRRCMSGWDQDRIAQTVLRHDCDWIFSPPKASHYGGVWERLIRSVRRCLRAILAEQLVNDETLLTVMTEVEKILNDRPLVKLSDDPTDYDVLTPNHLLLMYRNPAADLATDSPQSKPAMMIHRWKTVNHLAANFWRRWSREYLAALQSRSKWQQPQTDLKEGDLVLLVDHNAHRGNWVKGVVHSAPKANDGAVREVIVRTVNGQCRRDVRQICRLEAHC